MVTPSAGSIILVPFPFSDLSHSKLRPAVVLADAAKGEWVLCQITPRLTPAAPLPPTRRLSSTSIARGGG